MTTVSNVLGGNSCKRDNNNFSEKDKYNNKKNRAAYCGKTFEEMLENAQKAMRVDISTPRFDAIGDVLEDILSFKDLDIENRISNIERAYSNKDLESILGLSQDYYREKYFALLKIVAMSTDIK